MLLVSTIKEGKCIPLNMGIYWNNPSLKPF